MDSDKTILPPQGLYAQLEERDFIGAEGEDDLFIACAKGTIEEIDTYFSDPPAVKEHNTLGYGPLHVVVLSDRPDVEAAIDAVLRHGVDINCTTIGEGDTALHLVAHRGDFWGGLRLGAKLVENGAETDTRNKKLRTPYDCAISREFLSLAALLSAQMKPEQARQMSLRDSRKYWGEQLITSVLNSDRAGIEKCLGRGADTSILNQHGAGAIHYAVTHCRLPPRETLAAMVEAGCEINIQDHEGDTALNLVIKTKKLRESGEMSRIVEMLLNNGADRNVQDLDRKDSRQLAAERGYQDIVNMLGRPLKPEPATPLPPEPVPEPPVEPEPEPDAHPPTPEREPTPEPDPLPETEPEKENEPEEEETLEDLPHRTAVNKPDNNGLCPIHRAMYIRTADKRRTRVDELVALNANLDIITSKERNTALHLAVQEGRADTLTQLLRHKARYRIFNKAKKTPLDVAKAGGFTECQRVLEEFIAQKEKDEQSKKGGGCVVT